MPTQHDDHRGRASRTVRPLGVWAGVAAAVLGVAAIGVGAVSGWGPWLATWVGLGVVLVGVGAVIGWRSGGLYAVHGPRDLGDTVHDVLHDETYQGVAPGDTVSSPEARATSAGLDRRRREIEAARRATPPPPLAPLGAIVLVLAALGLLVAAGAWYPHDAVGSANADRALGCAIVAALTGMRFLLSPGPHRVFAGAALLAAIGLMLSGPLAPHDRAGTVALEFVVGGIVALAALTCALSPQPARGA